MGLTYAEYEATPADVVAMDLELHTLEQRVEQAAIEKAKHQ
jgi:hypothetical protein